MNHTPKHHHQQLTTTVTTQQPSAQSLMVSFSSKRRPHHERLSRPLQPTNPVCRRMLASLKTGRRPLRVMNRIYETFMKFDHDFCSKANYCINEGILPPVIRNAHDCLRGQYSTTARGMDATQLTLAIEALGVTNEYHERWQLEADEAGEDFLAHHNSDNMTAAQASPDRSVQLKAYILRRAESEVLVKSLYIIGMLCFNNTEVTSVICELIDDQDHVGGLLPLLDQCLRMCVDTSTTTAVAHRSVDRQNILKAALYFMCNLTANSFVSHAKVRHLLPHVTSVLANNSLSPCIRSEAVRVCFYLSANDECAADLISSGVVDPLAKIMCAPDSNLDCTSAVIAVANVIGGRKGHPAYGPVLAAIDAGALVECFAACLNGHDYPRDSNLFYRNWKVAKGLSKLAGSDAAIAHQLRSQGLVRLLQRALDGDNTDEEMHRFSLQLLWQLSRKEDEEEDMPTPMTV